MEQVNLDSEQVREVFARFGLAMFLTQALERQLAIFLASKHGESQGISRAQFDSLLGSNFQQTLGKLVRDLQEHKVSIPSNLQQDLENALKQRNWLAHHYFWVRAVDFTNGNGRIRMIEELKAKAHFFEQLDQLLTKMTKEWGQRHGITDEVLQEELERLLEDHQVEANL